jgi:hypothetical protein
MNTNTISNNFKAGFEKLSEMAKTQPEAQKAMFDRLAPIMADLANYYDTLPNNNNYESYGHEFCANKNLSTNDARVVVAFTSQAIKLGR